MDNIWALYQKGQKAFALICDLQVDYQIMQTML